MEYLILTTSDALYAEAMSALLWSLARPNGSDGTTLAVSWITHTDGRVALHIDGYVQRVATDADVTGFVAAMPVPQDEKDTLTTVLNNARGSSLAVVDWIPATLLANMISQAEAESDGWFPAT